MMSKQITSFTFMMSNNIIYCYDEQITSFTFMMSKNTISFMMSK
jgi:hypothetical protein